jgi:glutathione synthase/RimK-type ligase-like ATP-grasp enzyme
VSETIDTFLFVQIINTIKDGNTVMIGIHQRMGSFSDRWVEYCMQRNIPFRQVNCLASDVVQQCAGLDALLWQWVHHKPEDQLVAFSVIASLEAAGLRVFPSVKTCWHYDDKVAQKYLLEAIKAPLVPTRVFTCETEALQWCQQADWPKVFKLRNGAGSSNVRLVSSKEQAVSLCRQAFGRGFPAVAGYLADLTVRLKKTRTAKDFREKLARAPRSFLNLLALRQRVPRERGYAYFQDFLPGNSFDTRVTIIGNRAFGFIRENRPGDFRASGSGSINVDPRRVDLRCVKIAFDVADRIGTQSLAFDFLFNPSREPMIGEISYCYMPAAIHGCPGHWDRALKWRRGATWPQDAILDDLLANLGAVTHR